MNLWEDVFGRWPWRHSPSSSPPTPPTWRTDVVDLFPRSHLVNIEDATDTRQDDVDSAEPPVDERAYAEDHRDEARDAIRTSGTEAIAFYAPIHGHGRERWGIYFHERVFFGACAEAASSLPNSSWNDIIADMLHTVERHEVFHAAVELFALVLEDFAFLGDMDIQQRMREASNPVSETPNLPEMACPHQSYFKNDYLPSLPTERCLEESLATASQFRSRCRTPGFRRVLEKMIEHAPPSYRAWRSYRSSAELQNGIQSLANKIICAAFEQPRAVSILASGLGTLWWFPEIVPSCLDEKGPVPRWIYHADGRHPSRFAPAVLGSIRLRDFVKALVHCYGARIAPGGKHAAIVFPNGKKVPFASRRTVPPYLIGDVAQALGIQRREVLSTCLDIHV